jgi:hypothetical protein
MAPLKSKSVFLAVYRHPRESGGPATVAAVLPPLDSRFRGNDEKRAKAQPGIEF